MEVDPQKDPQTQPVDLAPQIEPLVGQIPNPGGGHSFPVDDLTRLLRFLCLGSDGCVYRANTQHRHFTRSNVTFINRLITDGRGKEVIQILKDVSQQGRACKHDNVIYALAECSSSNDHAIKREAFQSLGDICRIPTHLFRFIEYRKDMNAGWGRASRIGISEWYNQFSSDDTKQERPKNSLKLAYLVTKYRRRHGWTHKDVIRKAHLKPNIHIRTIIDYIMERNNDGNMAIESNVSRFLQAVRDAKQCDSVERIQELICEFSLAREHIPTRFLNDLSVWQCLFRMMPCTAMLRCLGKMTNIGLFDNRCQAADANLLLLKQRLDNVNKGSPEFPKIHPLTLLIAFKHYRLGHSRSAMVWMPNPSVEQYLQNAFDNQTKILPSTGKSYLFALSVGEDMNKTICGSSVTASEAAAAMILSTLRNETDVEVLLFANSIEDAFTSSLNTQDNLESINRKINIVREKCKSQSAFGTVVVTEDLGTPFKWAAERKKKYDVIIVFTSSLSSGLTPHPAEMLQQYMSYFAIKDYRLIVVGMSDNKYTAHSPTDMNALDVVGFDLHTPIAIREFVSDYEGDDFTRAVHDNHGDLLQELEAMGNLTLYD